MTGLFITVDGPGCIGKSTLVGTLAMRMRAHGFSVHTTAEPSNRPLGKFTRAHADQITGHALACLVAADRFDHLAHEIRPHKAAGELVLCDRYLGSSLVLQQIDGVPEQFILDINRGIDLPGLAVILTAPPETITRRITERGAHHRFERDPTIPAREIELYRTATVTLEALGVPVVTVDVGSLTPSGAAGQIARLITTRPANLDTSPTEKDPRCA